MPKPSALFPLTLLAIVLVPGMVVSGNYLAALGLMAFVTWRIWVRDDT